MIETFGIVGVCILAAVAAGIGIVGLVWIWSGEDDSDERDDWLEERYETEEAEDAGSR